MESICLEDDIPKNFNTVDDDSGSILRTLIDFAVYNSDGSFINIEDINESNLGTVEGYVIEPYDSVWANELTSLLCTCRQDAPKSEDQYAPKLPASTKKAKATIQSKIKSILAMENGTTNEETEGTDQNISPNQTQTISSNAITNDDIEALKQFDLNRKSLKVGDSIDAYCNKTFHWFEAKIIDIDTVNEKIKIHFKGWNPKFDEWLDVTTERIALLGSSSKLMYEAAKKAAVLIPWYEHDEILCRVSEKLISSTNTTTSTSSIVMNEDIKEKPEGLYSLRWKNQQSSEIRHLPLPPRQQLKVRIEGIEDWCIDYTYANPNLWLIARSGIWYRIAGVLCPGGTKGYPNYKYEHIYSILNEKFLCASQVAMVLFDILPGMLKLSLQDVADEVLIRSKGTITERHILHHSKLLLEQLSTIAPPADWDKRINISKSIFMSQLKKQGDIYLKSGGKFGLSAAASAALSSNIADIDNTSTNMDIADITEQDLNDDESVTANQTMTAKKRKADQTSTTTVNILDHIPSSIQDLPGWRAMYEGLEALYYISATEESKSVALMTLFQYYTQPPYNDKEYFNLQFLSGLIFPAHPKPSTSAVLLPTTNATSSITNNSLFPTPSMPRTH